MCPHRYSFMHIIRHWFRNARLWLAVMLIGTASTTSAADQVKLALTAMDGKQHSLSEYRGKWVIVNYWATSCPPCISEIPELQQFHNHHKDSDAVVIGVNYEDIRPDWLRDFMSSIRMTYPVWQASPESLTPFGDITMLPTTFVISPEGKLVARQVGPLTEAALNAYLARKQAGESRAGPEQRHVSDNRQEH